MKNILFTFLIGMMLFPCVYSDEQTLRQLFENDDPFYVELVKQYNKSHPKQYNLKTKLIEACGLGKYNIVKSLIECGVSVNSKNDIYVTPLHNVASVSDDDHLKIACLLITKGAKINAKAGLNATNGIKRKDTPLHYAVKIKDNLAMVKLLVENGAKINAKNYKNYTPLFNAVKGEQKEIVKYLLMKGAKINIKDKQKGLTAMHKSINRGNIDIIILLIAFGADLTINNKIGHNVYEHAQSFRWRNQDRTLLILQRAQTPEIQSLIKAGEKQKVISILSEIK